MRTLSEVAAALGAQRLKLNMAKGALGQQAGITNRTLQHVLSGQQDFKVSTLLAVADRLGLELLLVPKEATAVFVKEPPGPAVKTKVQAALERLRNRS